VRIRNDRPDRTTPRPGNGLTAEQLADAIWGPYRLKPEVRHTDRLGREHGPFILPRQEPYKLSLEPSTVPSWFTVPEMWRRDFEGAPIRLEITCRREGYEPWVLLREITPIDPVKTVWSKPRDRAASGVERLSCRPATRATRPDLTCAVLVRISLRRRRRFTDSDADSRLEAL
jgi:hypothetical protein